MYFLLIVNILLIYNVVDCHPTTQLQIPVPTECCGPSNFWPNGPSPGDACDPDPRCGSPFDNYERVGCTMCCKKGFHRANNKCFNLSNYYIISWRYV